jgi:phage baseplate assembly protein W
MASAGIDAATGRVLRDEAHVDQSLVKIFTTDFGARVMRRFFGSNLPRQLGENQIQETFLRFYSALGVALLQEPRIALTRIRPISVERTGRSGFQLELEDRPRGHLGDFTPAGKRRVIMSARMPDFTDITVTRE